MKIVIQHESPTLLRGDLTTLIGLLLSKMYRPLSMDRKASPLRLYNMKLFYSNYDGRANLHKQYESFQKLSDWLSSAKRNKQINIYIATSGSKCWWQCNQGNYTIWLDGEDQIE